MKDVKCNQGRTRPRQWRVLAALLVAFSLVAAACGDDDDVTTTQPEDTTTSSEDTTTTQPEDTTTTQPEDTSTGSDNGSGSVPDDGEVEASALDPVCQGRDGENRTVGFANLGESVPFAVSVREGIERVAELCNVEIVNADNALDGSIALDNARLFATQGVDAVIEFQVDGAVEQAVCDAIGDRPVIAIDIAHPSCAVFMGADNGLAGELAGQAAGAEAEARWSCEVDAIVTFEAYGVGQVNIDRLNGGIRGVQSVCGDLNLGDFEDWDPDEAGSIITRLDADRLDPGFEQGRDWLTANPDADQVIALCINDDSCLGFLAAVEDAGREGQVILASQGADFSVHDVVRENADYLGSTGYFPELYGEVLIPNIIAMMNGETVDDPLLIEHQFLDAAGVEEFYPADG